MYCSQIYFSTVPKIGFAHHFCTEKAHNTYYGKEKSIEIAYVEKGNLYGKFNDFYFEANEGDFLVLSRHLPMHLYTDGKSAHSHYSMQLIFEYDFSLVDMSTISRPPSCDLLIPFVTTQNIETEMLKRELISAISGLNISRENNHLSASITALNILNRINNIYSKKLRNNNLSGASLITYQIKKYISSNLHTRISLDDIDAKINKTPNYVNSVFKKETGITIIQYINQEKVRSICEFISNMGTTFSVACEAVGISDTSYGYRLFKKHMGVTPADYLILAKDEIQ